VPARTPAETVKHLQSEFAAVLQLPDIRARLAELGVDPVGSATADFRDFLSAERERFAQMYKYTGLTPD
jgi:tripartite-type tricarboxylate transporter receptor subunit TctC